MAGSSAFVLAAVLALLAGTSVGMFPDPMSCATYAFGAVDMVLNAAYDITSAVEDCALETLDEKSCASDLTDMMSYWFNLAQKISFMTLACGRLDNLCASDVTQALGDVSDVSTFLIAAASDCTPASAFICAYDIIGTMDAMDMVIVDVVGTLTDCNEGGHQPSSVSTAAFLAWNQGVWSDRRRLQEGPPPKDQEQVKEPVPPRGLRLSAAAKGEPRAAVEKNLTEAARLHEEAKADYARLSEQLGQRPAVRLGRLVQSGPPTLEGAQAKLARLSKELHAKLEAMQASPPATPQSGAQPTVMV